MSVSPWRLHLLDLVSINKHQVIQEDTFCRGVDCWSMGSGPSRDQGNVFEPTPSQGAVLPFSLSSSYWTPSPGLQYYSCCFCLYCLLLQHFDQPFVTPVLLFLSPFEGIHTSLPANNLHMIFPPLLYLVDPILHHCLKSEGTVVGFILFDEYIIFTIVLPLEDRVRA
jgi:hypothetical protein